MSQPLPEPAPPSERLSKLHDVAGLLSSLSGERERVAAQSIDADSAYDAASSLARVRFNELASRATALASAGIEALLASQSSSPAAMMVLAEAIDAEIAQLESLLVRT